MKMIGLTKLKLLYRKGKMTPKLKYKVSQMIKELKKKHYDLRKIQDLGWLHQEMYGAMKKPYGEDNDYNRNLAGTTVYKEFDYLWHSSLGEISDYRKK